MIAIDGFAAHRFIRQHRQIPSGMAARPCPELPDPFFRRQLKGGTRRGIRAQSRRELPTNETLHIIPHRESLRLRLREQTSLKIRRDFNSHSQRAASDLLE